MTAHRISFSTGIFCPGRTQSGFTLLELLLVVFILSALALTATAFVDNQDDQFRFEDTRKRLEMIRRAVLGRTDLVQGGQVIVSGFVADNGVLPTHLDNLTNNANSLVAVDLQIPKFDPQPDAVTGENNGGEIDLFAANEKLEKGWRVAYLHASPESSGAFRDGWGNKNGLASPALDDARNFGWQLNASTSLTVTSLGKDNKDAANGGGSASFNAEIVDTVQSADWSVEIAGLAVRIKSKPGADFVGKLRASLLVFENRSGAAKWKRYTTDTVTCLDGTGNGLADHDNNGVTPEVPCPNEATLIFPTGGYPGGSYGSTRVPTGRHLLVLVSDPDGTAHNTDDIPYLDTNSNRISRPITCYPGGCTVETLILI